MEVNPCHDKSMILISLFCVFIDDVVREWVGPCRGFKFAVRGPQKIDFFWGHFKQKEQFDPNFFWKLCRLWSCPFICIHRSEIAIQELPTFITVKCIIMDSIRLLVFYISQTVCWIKGVWLGLGSITRMKSNVDITECFCDEAPAPCHNHPQYPVTFTSPPSQPL